MDDAKSMGNFLPENFKEYKEIDNINDGDRRCRRTSPNVIDLTKCTFRLVQKAMSDIFRECWFASPEKKRKEEKSLTIFASGKNGDSNKLFGGLHRSNQNYKIMFTFGQYAVERTKFSFLVYH